jgi:hypothetical protein
MKKLFIFTILICTTFLVACQGSPPPTTSPISEEEIEKATSTSAVQIHVADPSEETTITIDGVQLEGAMDAKSLEVITETEVPTATTPSALTDKKGAIITEEGIIPAAITAQKGTTLMISNGLDKQADLYTTSDGAQDCGFLDATIEIPGKQTKEFKLDQTGSCTIINQLNTAHKIEITVE